MPRPFQLSPFRIQLFLSLPFIACMLWFAYSFLSSDKSHRSRAEFILTSNDHYATSYIDIATLTRIVAHSHETDYTFLGIHYYCSYFDSTAPFNLADIVHLRSIEISWWLLVPVSLIPLLLYKYLTRHTRRATRRREQGLCPTCAYDLRAHAPGTLCPECGTPIASD